MSTAAPHEAGGRARWWRPALALGLLAAVLVWVDPGRVGAVLAGIDPWWWGAGLLSSTAANVLSAWRWRDGAAWLGYSVPWRWAFVMYFRGVAANVVMPGAVVGGDVLRAWGLRRRGVPVLEAGVSVVLDRLSGLWGLAILGAVVWGVCWIDGIPLPWEGALARWLGLSAGWLGVAAWCAAGLAVGVPAVALAITPWGAARWMGWERSPWRWWLKLARHAPWHHGTRQLIGSLAVQAASVTTLYCAAHAVGAPLPWATLAIAAVPVFVFATLPVGFGGWGTREAAAVLVLAPAGVEASHAVAIAVLYGLYPIAQSALALWPMGSSAADHTPAPPTAAPHR